MHGSCLHYTQQRIRICGRWATAYMIFQDFLWYPLQHQWMYFFMQTDTLMVIPWMLGLLIVHWLFYGVICCLAMCKLRCGCGSEPILRMDRPHIQTPLGKPIELTRPWLALFWLVASHAYYQAVWCTPPTYLLASLERLPGVNSRSPRAQASDSKLREEDSIEWPRY